MNTLPSNIGRHTLFRDNSNSHTFVFQDAYPLPTPDKIKMQVRYNGRVLADINPEITVEGQRVTYTYTPEMLAKIPSIVQHYLVLDGKSLIGGELGVLVGYGQQDITETQVTVTDGEVTVVQVAGLDVVAEQVTIATEKAAEATTQAGISAAGAVTATSKAGEAAGSATAAANAQAAAEEAAQTAIDNSLERIDVATYAEAEPYFTGSRPRKVFVEHDEAYGELVNGEYESTFYEYYPGKGTALLGIDFNYTEE